MNETSEQRKARKAKNKAKRLRRAAAELNVSVDELIAIRKERNRTNIIDPEFLTRNEDRLLNAMWTASPQGDWVTADEIEKAWRLKHPHTKRDPAGRDATLKVLEARRIVSQSWRDGIPVWREAPHGEHVRSRRSVASA